MRFLIFNMVVFLSIGYLFTAAPDQSVGNWIDATIDKASQTVASASPPVVPKQVPAPADKLEQLVISKPLPVASQNNDIKINSDTIQKIISDSVNSYLEEIVAGSGGIQADNTAPLPRVALNSATTAENTTPLPIDRASQTVVTATTKDLVKQSTTLPLATRGSAESDELLASGFSELYPANQKAVAAAREELVPQDIVATQVFMNSGDRQAALSELIQNLQLTYLERAGQ